MGAGAGSVVAAGGGALPFPPGVPPEAGRESMESSAADSVTTDSGVGALGSNPQIWQGNSSS